MESQAQDLHYIVEVYREQFGRVHHLDRMALTTFAIIAALVLALSVLLGLGVMQDKMTQFGAALLAMGLAAGGAHAIIANASDYWITFVVIAQLTRGLGLVQRGLFPVSLLACIPQGVAGFTRRLLGGFRGPLFIIYLVLGWHSSFLMLSVFLDVSLAFGLAIPVPLALAAGSAAFTYDRLRRQMAALRRHEELVEGKRSDIVASHCELAEALLWLDPPRLFHAQRQYELALEIEPDNPRAKEGLQRVLTWRGK